MTRPTAHTLTVQIVVTGIPWQVPAGTSVAAALAQQSPGTTRTSVIGQLRAPLCGMGVCQACRVLINGRERLACQSVCEDGMLIATSTAHTGGAT